MNSAPHWLSAVEANSMWPDAEHFESTLENLDSIYNASEDLECWRIEKISPAQIEPFQLHVNNPADAAGLEKIASIRASMCAGTVLPPVWIVHQPGNQFPWSLLEGYHRFNAAYEEDRELLAWVAHIGCCQGPAADLQ